jgi:hypothetical protein
MTLHSKLAAILDKVSSELESKGLVSLAADLDTVANALDPLDSSDEFAKTAMGQSPKIQNLMDQARRMMDPTTREMVNKILGGDTSLLQQILAEAENAPLEDARRLGLKTAGLPNAGKVISALLLAASLAMAGGQHPTGVLKAIADHAQKNPKMENVLKQNLKEISDLGAKGLDSVEKAHQSIHDRQVAEAEAEKAKQDAAKLPSAPNPADDVWRT